MRYFLYNIKTKIIENCIIFDPKESNWKPSKGYELIEASTVIADIGWSKNDAGIFVAPPEPKPNTDAFVDIQNDAEPSETI